MKWKIRDLSLKTQLIVFSVLGVALGVMVVTAISLSMFRAEIVARIAQDQEKHIKIFWSLLPGAGGSMRLQDGRLMAGPVEMNNNSALVDRVVELCGGVASVFAGDTRIATSIAGADGKRVVGSRLQGPAYDAIFRSGAPYRGESRFEGRVFLTAYDPIRDANGRVIGALAVGVAEEGYFTSFHRLERSLLLLAALTLLGIAFLTYLYARYAFAPITTAAEAAGRIASGDLTGELGSDRGDETGLLLRALQKMIVNLRDLLGQVRASGIQLTSASNQVNAAAHVQRNGAAELNDACAHAVHAAADVALTGEHALETMERAFRVLEDAVEAANAGQKRLSDMDEAMRELTRGAESASLQLGEINAKTAKISQAVVVMTKVADRTNLLSLNAAIEAKKAGEAGKGFSVLSEEIARLADQSAAGTLEIEQMALEVQQTVAAGVEEMERHAQKVEWSAQASAETSHHLARIIRLVQQLKPQFASVAESMRAQGANGEKIQSVIHNLTDGAHAASSSIQNLQEATERLNAVVKSLREEINKFRM